MSPSFRHALAAGVALALSACAPDSQTVHPAPSDWPRAPQPVVWNSFDSTAGLELSIPDAVKAQPALYPALRDEGVVALRDFLRTAHELRDGHPDLEERVPLTMVIGYDAPVETDRLFSLQETSWTYEGGAHGAATTDGVLWDKVHQVRIEPIALMRAGADLTPLDQALCDAVNAAKRERLRRSLVDNPDAGPMDPATQCKAMQTAFALAPGTTPGKAGGLIFRSGSYGFGAYAEGGYEIVVPFEAFRSLLAPAWADQFDGAPAAATLDRYKAG